MTKSGVITMSRSNIRDWRIRQIIYFQPKNPSNRVAKLATFLDWDPKKEDLYPQSIKPMGEAGQKQTAAHKVYGLCHQSVSLH